MEILYERLIGKVRILLDRKNLNWKDIYIKRFLVYNKIHNNGEAI